MNVPVAACLRRCVLGVMLSVGMAASALEASDQRQLADGLYKRGLHEMAAKEYTRLLQEFPDYGDKHPVWFRLAEAYRELGNNRDALGYYNHLLLSSQPSEFQEWAFLRKGQVLAAAGRVEPAMDSYRTLLAREGGEPGLRAAARYYLAVILREAGDSVAAEKAFQGVIEDLPEGPYAAYAGLELGRLLEERHAAREAVEAAYVAASEATGARPEVAAEALWSLGSLRHRSGEHADALVVFQRLFRQYPETPQALQARLPAAWSLHHLGRFEESRALQSEWAAREGSGSPASWEYLAANNLRLSGNLEEALAAYRRLMAEHPDVAWISSARYEAALVAGKLAAHEQVVALAGPLVEDPDAPADALWLLANAFREMGQNEKALQAYEKLLDRQPPDDLAAAAHFARAQLMQEAERHPEAEKAFVIVARKYPDYTMTPNAWFAAAFSAARSGALARAGSYWRALVQNYPDHGLADDALFQAGVSALREKQHQEASTWLQQLVQDYPESAFVSEARFWLATIADAAGDAAAARRGFEAVLADTGISTDLRDKARYRLAVLLRSMGDPPAAARLIDALLADQTALPLDSALVLWAARALLDAEDWEAALRTGRHLAAQPVQEIVRQAAGHVAARAALALDRQKEAEGLWQAVLDLPAPSEARADAGLSYGNLLRATGRPQAAVAPYEASARAAAAIGRLDVQARSLLGLGDAVRDLGDLAAAGRYYMSVAVLFDDPALTPVSLESAAAVFDQLGRKKEAAQARAELKKRYPEYGKDAE